jgi:hypothetical protein
VGSSLGTVVTDTNGYYAGSQVTVTGGHFSFQLRRPTAAGAPVLTAVALDGSASGTDASGSAVNYSLAPVRRYDFIAGSDPGASGFVPVTASTLYGANTGYGWASPVQGFDRGSAPGKTTTNLYRAGAWNYGGASNAGVFKVQVDPTKLYSLRLYVGDATNAWGNITVTVSGSGGTQQQTVSTAAGQWQALVFNNLGDSGGLLTVTISTTGYAWVANGLDIWQAGATDPGQAP